MKRSKTFEVFEVFAVQFLSLTYVVVCNPWNPWRFFCDPLNFRGGSGGPSARMVPLEAALEAAPAGIIAGARAPGQERMPVFQVLLQPRIVFGEFVQQHGIPPRTARRTLAGSLHDFPPFPPEAPGLWL
jgi:hypothetical protein